MPGAELHAGRIATAAAAIALVVIGVVAAVLLWLHESQPAAGAVQRPYALDIPGPTLQAAPQPDLAAYQEQKDRRLHGRGWVDAPAHVVHIPIEDAMALLAARAASAPEAAR
jgi:hypothetical protein